MNILRNLAVFGSSLALGLAVTAPANAISGFQDAYDPSNWTLQGSGSSVNTTGAPGSITLTNNAGNGFVDYFVTAVGDGTVNFDYSTNLESGFDGFLTYLNGSRTSITSQNITGSSTINVTTGDQFGFSLSEDSADSTANVTISNFSAPDPTAVPFDASPNLGILIVLGLAGANYAKKKFTATK